MQLSPNFTLAELTVSEIAQRKGLNNDPPSDVLNNLQRLAEFLEGVRKVLGKPILINSAYRSLEVNQAVGGSKNSQHMTGCAADIRVPGMTPDQVCRAIIQSDIQYEQLIREFDSWTHISIPNDPKSTPKNQTLIIDKQGTRKFS